LQALDLVAQPHLVAQPRCLLELEVAGRLLHPLLEFADGRLQVLTDEEYGDTYIFYVSSMASV
jgi:hypothetical protein